MHQSLPPGISLVTADGFKEWQMDIRVLDPNPLYLNQIYRLRFRFSNNYPIGILTLQISPSSTQSPTSLLPRNTLPILLHDSLILTRSHPQKPPK